jgi:hypothetical protein
MRAMGSQECASLSTSQTSPNDASSSLENKYYYSPLPRLGTIRLLCLLPHKEQIAPIECQLFDYLLQAPDRETHLYDALSYVWGSPIKPLSISIEKVSSDKQSIDRCQLHITANLHTALVHLRDHSLKRIIWIDAICINQEDLEERGQQVRLMAEIYCKANHVIVWLGEVMGDGDRTLKAIRTAADSDSPESLNNKANQQAILRLLQRPWFQRIWVRTQDSQEYQQKFANKWPYRYFRRLPQLGI